MKKYLVILIALVVAMMACAAVASADDPYPVEPGKVIDYGQIGQITELGGHPVANGRTILQPTCTEYGIAEFECLTPEAHAETTAWHYVKVAPLGHDMSSEHDQLNWGRVVTEPTCTEPGSAVDICLREGCGFEDWDYQRLIEPKGHTFLMDVYRVPEEFQPRCNKTGLGVRTCIHCGADNPDDVAALLTIDPWNNYPGPVIPVVDHKWSAWRTEVESTCGAYGKAKRTCIWCGDTQILDTDHRSVFDHGVEIFIDDVIPMPNNGWEIAEDFLDEKMFDSEEDEILAFRAVDENIEEDGLLPFQYVVSRKWLIDCYTREITLHCPCGCNGTVHEDIVYYQVAPYTISHTWVLQEAGPLTPDDTTAAEILDQDGDNEWFLNNDQSLEPTCVLPGFDLYLCAYDDVHDHNYSIVYDEDPAFWKDYKPALGHDWGPWTDVERFVVDGEEYVKRLCVCQRGDCGAVKNEVIKVSDIPVPPTPEVKNGLVLDPDGQFRYYKDGEFYPLTNIVRYDGAEFWVVEGIVPLNASGVVVCPDGKAYFLEQGRVLRTSGVKEYQNEWFIVKDGVVDINANGLFDYDGGKFVFAAGKLRKDVNGLWQNPQDKKWYFLSQGQVQAVTQVAEYNGQFFVIENGILNEKYNGTIEYDGETFRVVNGQLYPME